MIQILLLVVAVLAFLMALHVFRGGEISLNADTNLEGRPAQIVAVVLLVLSIAAVLFAFVGVPLLTH